MKNRMYGSYLSFSRIEKAGGGGQGAQGGTKVKELDEREGAEATKGWEEAGTREGKVWEQRSM